MNPTQLLRRKTTSGFTRSDLVAALAGTFILAAVALPAIGSSRHRSNQEVCSDNLRALMRATQLYAEDHRDEFPMVPHGGDAQAGQPINYASPSSGRPWVTGWLDWTTAPANTNTAFLVDSRYAVLGNYTRDAKLYKCPADTILSGTQRSRRWTGRVRSYSANGVIGRGNKAPSDGLINAEKLFFKLADVDRPSPSQLYVFIEEHADSINDGAFFNSQLSLRWIDLPAAQHPTASTNNSSNFVFVDGHVENHAWQASVLAERPNTIYNPPNARPGDPDWAWLMDRTSYNRNAVR